MKVKNIITVMRTVLDILEVYEDKTVGFMLSDIKGKVTDSKIQKGQTKEIKKNNPEETILLLRSINRDQVKEYLKKLDKNELEEIVTLSSLAVEPKETKQKLIDKLANHYNLLNVNEQMARRYADDPTESTTDAFSKSGFFDDSKKS